MTRDRDAAGGGLAVGDVEEDRTASARSPIEVVTDHGAIAVVRQDPHVLGVTAWIAVADVDPPVVVGARRVVVPPAGRPRSPVVQPGAGIPIDAERERQPERARRRPAVAFALVAAGREAVVTDERGPRPEGQVPAVGPLAVAAHRGMDGPVSPGGDDDDLP